MNEIGQVTHGQSAVHACHTGADQFRRQDLVSASMLTSTVLWCCMFQFQLMCVPLAINLKRKAAPSCRAAAATVARRLLEPLQSCHSYSAAHLPLLALACHVRPRQPPAE